MRVQADHCMAKRYKTWGRRRRDDGSEDVGSGIVQHQADPIFCPLTFFITISHPHSHTKNPLPSRFDEAG